MWRQPLARLKHGKKGGGEAGNLRDGGPGGRAAGNIILEAKPVAEEEKRLPASVVGKLALVGGNLLETRDRFLMLEQVKHLAPDSRIEALDAANPRKGRLVKKRPVADAGKPPDQALDGGNEPPRQGKGARGGGGCRGHAAARFSNVGVGVPMRSRPMRRASPGSGSKDGLRLTILARSRPTSQSVRPSGRVRPGYGRGGAISSQRRMRM